MLIGYARAMKTRVARPGDIPAIVAIEQTPGFEHSIGRWAANEHARAMSGEDAEYLVLADEEAIQGFAILLDITSEHRSMCLKRIAVAVPGKGMGRRLLESVLARVFDHHRAHRLWLDVFPANERARRVYENYGFRYEGELREAIRRDSDYYTVLVMALLDREYRQAATKLPGSRSVADESD